MQPLGILFIVLGFVSMLVRSVTFFTTETVTGPAGFFAWDVERPYTFFIHPMIGILAIVVGTIMVASSPRERAI